MNPNIKPQAPTETTPNQPQPLRQPDIPRGIHPTPQPDLSLQPSSGDAKPTRLKVRSRKLKLALITGLLFLVGLGLVISASVIWYQSQLRPVSSGDARYQVITIHEGSTTNQIAENLQKKKLIRSATAFRIHLRLSGNTGLQAGDYRLTPSQSSSEIAAIIAEGKVSTVNILIPPGLRLDEIKALIIKAGYDDLAVDDALARVRDHSLIKDLPNNTLLEGYLFPDTYSVGPQTDAETLLRMMLDNFEEQITKDIRDNLSARNITLKDAIILASIIQKEVPDYDTQRIVAQVFIKRLKDSKPLGADPTFKYVASMTGKPASPSLDSPYNTRIYSGLPPTPIANFNISALKAVAYPSRTDYNYFVSGDDGKTHFTHTLEQHESATHRYCTTLCE